MQSYLDGFWWGGVEEGLAGSDRENESKEENLCVVSWEEKQGIFIKRLILLAQHGSINQKEGFK